MNKFVGADYKYCKSFVYVISDGTHIKIGRTEDIHKRIKSIQTGNPNRLCVEKLYGFDTKEEAILAEDYFHQMFKAYRLQGEWFDQECLNIINALNIRKRIKDKINYSRWLKAEEGWK